jgi:hypothetical protein
MNHENQEQAANFAEPNAVKQNSDVEDNKTPKQQTAVNEVAKKPLSEEKTAMCAIHELARFNKLNLQYILQNEVGPAHKKTFYIKLKLCDGEEYHAEGTSIKKAQQAAAKMALDKTKFPRPLRNEQATRENMLNQSSMQKKRQSTNTPTVRLNALAMKYGFEPQYNFFDKNFNRFQNNGLYFRSFRDFNSSVNTEYR